jgi:hypothetical protein
MKTLTSTGWVLALTAFVLAGPVWAQKGKGDTEGLARLGVQANIVTVTGHLDHIKDGPCSHTTGREVIGTHLFLKTDEGQIINLHVGPSKVVKTFADALTVGDLVSAQVVKTDKLRAEEYIVKSVSSGENTLTVRDDNLRPVWARAGGRIGTGLRWRN